MEVRFKVLGDLYGGTLRIARSDDSKAIAVIFDPDQDVVCRRLMDAMKPRLAEIQSRIAGSLVELITNTS